jgi:hypothetical protein
MPAPSPVIIEEKKDVVVQPQSQPINTTPEVQKEEVTERRSSKNRNTSK